MRRLPKYCTGNETFFRENEKYPACSRSNNTQKPSNIGFYPFLRQFLGHTPREGGLPL
jgi:hypothetical protein